MTKEERLARKAEASRRKAITTIKAQRLASCDFHYEMDPHRTAIVARVDPEEAIKLRAHPAYLAKLAELGLQMDAINRVGMERDSLKIRMKMAELVPEALERLADQVMRDDVIGQNAAKEILDRDGRLPKVSRVQQTIEDKSGLQEPDAKTIEEFKASRPN